VTWLYIASVKLMSRRLAPARLSRRLLKLSWRRCPP
jgi:hypothetical protein